MVDKQLKDKAVSIKGKAYVLVSDRVLYFNEQYPNGAIETDYTLDGDTYHFKALVIPDTEKSSRRFTGHSQATIGDGMVNKTAAMENAETSAVGRALAMMGIGVIESIASVDEINKAQGSQGSDRLASEKQLNWLRDTAARVYGLENKEDIDKAIEDVLKVPVDQIKSKWIKPAVDKISADKPADTKVVVNLPEGEVNLNDLPY